MIDTFQERTTMSKNLFADIRRLLVKFTEDLDQHSIGNEMRDEAQRIVDEIDILIKNKDFIEHIEEEIDEEEFRQASDEIAEQILTQSCPNGNCEM